MANLNPVYFDIVFSVAEVDNKKAYEYADYNTDKTSGAAKPTTVANMKSKMQAYERFRNLETKITNFGSVIDSKVIISSSWSATAASIPTAGALTWKVCFASANDLLDVLFALDPNTDPVTQYPNTGWPVSNPETYIVQQLKARLDSILTTKVDGKAFECWTDPTRTKSSPPTPADGFYVLGMDHKSGIPAGTGETTVTISGPSPFK